MERIIKRVYKVKLQDTDEGFAVSVCDLPGCWSQGKTEKEALENVEDALQAYLETSIELNKGSQSS